MFNRISKALVIALSLSAPCAFAHNQTTIISKPDWQFEQESGLLSLNACLNQGLSSGEYLFANLHGVSLGKKGYGFFDEWSFTLSESANVTISLFDDVVPLFPGNPAYGSQSTGSGNLLDNKFLTVSLFDANGALLGTAGEQGTLSALGLVAGDWYTLTVSGKTAGLLGGLYHGSLAVAPVPIGDSLPLFASALTLAAFRLRRHKALPAA